jgi:endoglycosylceramidase
VKLIFRRHGETAQRLVMPMLVGEWGAYGRNPGTLPTAWHVVHQFEKLLCSETYWAYEPGIQDFACFQAVQRPYPERVAGTLSSYQCNPDTGSFECVWQEDEKINAPSRIYLPGWFSYHLSDLNLDPPGMDYQIKPTSPGSENHYLVIPSEGDKITRTLAIKCNS